MLEYGLDYRVFDWSPDSPKIIYIGNHHYAENEVEIQDDDLLDVRVFAKKILDIIEWPTQIEGKQRQDVSVDISELLEKAWLLYEKDTMHESKNNRIQEFYDELYFWEYVPDVVEELATLHSLPNITVRAWQEMSDGAPDGSELPDRLSEVSTDASHELSEWFLQQWRP